MKVCTYLEKIEEKNLPCLAKQLHDEQPLLALLPTLPDLQAWNEQLAISWFRRENEQSRAIISQLHLYCQGWVDHYSTSSPDSQEIHSSINQHLQRINDWSNDTCELDLDKKIKAEMNYLSCDLIAFYLCKQGFSTPTVATTPLVKINIERKIDMEESQTTIQNSLPLLSTAKLIISPLSICENAYGEVDFLSHKRVHSYISTLRTLLEKELPKTKKRLLITSNQSLVNLKSNTYEKNTVQRYYLLNKQQISGLKQGRI